MVAAQVFVIDPSVPEPIFGSLDAPKSVLGTECPIVHEIGFLSVCSRRVPDSAAQVRVLQSRPPSMLPRANLPNLFRFPIRMPPDVIAKPFRA
jgi:hypothetical protein